MSSSTLCVWETNSFWILDGRCFPLCRNFCILYVFTIENENITRIFITIPFKHIMQIATPNVRFFHFLFTFSIRNSWSPHSQKFTMWNELNRFALRLVCSKRSFVIQMKRTTSVIQTFPNQISRTKTVDGWCHANSKTTSKSSFRHVSYTFKPFQTTCEKIS